MNSPNVSIAPSFTGWNAHDILPNDHKNYRGRPGSVGDRAGNFTIQNADYVLVLGSRLNIWQISHNFRAFASKARACMVDIDRAELNNSTLNIAHKVHAELKGFLAELLSAIRAEEAVSRSDHVDYFAWCRRRVSRYPTVLPEYRGNPGGKMNPYYFIEELFAKLPPDAHVVCGDGTACVVTFQAAFIKQQTRLFRNCRPCQRGARTWLCFF